MNTFFINAMNVHTGGGASLLRSLLMSIPKEYPTVAILDERFVFDEHSCKNITAHRVKATIKDRWGAEYNLSKNVKKNDIVLCFGNLPPLFHLKGYVVVFVQNRILIDDKTIKNFPPITRLRLWIEKTWLAHFAHNADFFITQTPSMQRLLARKLKLPITSIQNWPLSSVSASKKINCKSKNLIKHVNHTGEIDFIYPASGEPHKNHITIIKAWSILAEQKIFPSLYLTIDQSKYPHLHSQIESARTEHGLKIINLGFLPHNELMRKYNDSKALIYPSVMESYGLPLIEAEQAGLAILAAELDYVRDVVTPDQTFDPSSPLSISRAVRRFNHTMEGLTKPMDAEEFIRNTINISNKCKS